jgi:uridine kinase
MVTQYVERKLNDKSTAHRAELVRLGKAVEDEPISSNVILLEQMSKLRGVSAIIQDRDSLEEDFVSYFDRLATLLVEQ